MPIDATAYASGNYLLQLDGKSVGFLRTIEGGEPYIDVVNEAANAGLIAKHPGQLHYAPITITVGFTMDALFFQWVAATLDRQAVRKSGVIIIANYNFQEVARLSFNEALITEIQFPKFDGASKDAGYLTVTFQPRSATFTASPPGTKVDSIAQKQKLWLSPNFRVSIPGLETACAKVSAIDTIDVVIPPGVEPGVLRSLPSTGPLTVSNPVLTAPDTVAPDFAAWFDDFAARGNAAERTATIDLLSADLATTLFTVSLSNVGIVRVKHERFDTGADDIQRVAIELYCETIGLTSPAAPFAAVGAVVAPATPVLKPLSTTIPVRPV